MADWAETAAGRAAEYFGSSDQAAIEKLAKDFRAAQGRGIQLALEAMAERDERVRREIKRAALVALSEQE